MRSRRTVEWATYCAAAFARVCPDTLPQPLFVCPLCLTTASPDDAESLSLEDAPIKALGGLPMTVTCRPCNNRAGSVIEKHTERHARWWSTPSAVPRAVTMKLDDATHVNAEMTFKDGELAFNMEDRFNSPANRSSFRAMFSQGTPDDPAVLDFAFAPDHAFDERVADLGWLKASYITMFAAFGYSAILSPNYRLIREQLQRPDQALVDGFYCEREAPDDTRAIYVLSAPAELEGCYVIQIGRRGVFLPYPFRPSDPYPYLRTVRGTEAGIAETTVAHRIEWPTRPVMQFDDGRFTWDVDASTSRG